MTRIIASALVCLAASHAGFALAEGNAGASQGGQTSASSRMDIGVVIPEVIRMRVLEQPSHLQITAEDIQRGYVTSQSSVEIISNSRAGFGMQFELQSGVVESGQVEGLGLPVTIADGMAGLRLTHQGRQMKRVVYALSYRFLLSANSTPGLHRWPLLVAASS